MLEQEAQLLLLIAAILATDDDESYIMDVAALKTPRKVVIKKPLAR